MYPPHKHHDCIRLLNIWTKLSKTNIQSLTHTNFPLITHQDHFCRQRNILGSLQGVLANIFYQPNLYYHW